MTLLTANLEIEHKSNGIKINDILKYYQSLNNNVLTVGVHKEAGAELVKRARHTEFGTQSPNPPFWYEPPYGFSGTVPPRPVIRMYLYPQMRDGINNSYLRALEQAKNSKMINAESIANQTLKKVGEASALMQKEQVFLRNYDISTNKTNYDPNYNGEKTINYKGFDMPWIGRTGQTVEAINYKIRKRGI